MQVQPKVIKLAETKLLPEGVEQLAEQFTATDWLSKAKQTRRNDTEFLVELAGRTCYRSFGLGLNPNITKIRESSGEYLANVVAKGEGSLLEHTTVTFAFLNVSRVFTHELVRHRVGTATSQESLRYVRPKDIRVWMPPDLEPVSKQFLMAVEQIANNYGQLERSFHWDDMGFEEKKTITSALRRILPNGIATNMIWTANHRALRWIIEMRTRPSAEVEIRTVFGAVAEICIKDYPNLYADFSRQPLADGTIEYIPENSKV